MVNELNLYLGSQPIYIAGFGFHTMGSSLLGDLVAHSCLCKPLSIFHRVAPFSLDIVALFSLFSPELPTLTFHSILLFIA